MVATPPFEVPTARLAIDGPIGGFVAGTLVHTNKGLVPIQDIKLGDLVLSRPENGAANAYRRVVKTFKIESRPISYISCIRGQNSEIEFLDKYDGLDFDQLVAKSKELETVIGVTGNHLFWVEGTGWKAAELLTKDNPTLLCNGDAAYFNTSIQIKKAIQQNADIGWAVFGYDGRDLVFGEAGMRVSSGNTWETGDISDSDDFLAEVYNLEVEDFQSFFIGQSGIWVQSSNCGVRTV